MPIGIPLLEADADGLDTFEQIRAWILSRADEPEDGTSDFHGAARRVILTRWRELYSRHVWQCLRARRPGVILTDPAQEVVLTAPVGVEVAAELAAPLPDPTLSLEGYIVLPAGQTNAQPIRVVEHEAGATALVLDAVPEPLSAAPCTLARVDYPLPRDCGIFIDSGFWARDGAFVPLVSEETLRRAYPGRPDRVWPPAMAARVEKFSVRLSSYAATRERLEFPYQIEPPDPTGDAELVLDRHLRIVLADGALALLYELKGDRRQREAEQRWLIGLDQGKEYEHLLAVGTGGHANRRSQGAYGDRRRRG